MPKLARPRSAHPGCGAGGSFSARLPALGRYDFRFRNRSAGRPRARRRRQKVRSMSRRVIIQPVTRIEGHAKISIQLDDAGEVESARFHVTEFRGFEKLCEGRPFQEMPGLMSRVCGICPVSHVLASSKAGDMLLGVEIPAGGRKAAAPGQLRAGSAVPRAQLFPSLVARSAAGYGCAAGRAQYFRLAGTRSGFSAARHPAAPVRSARDRTGGREEGSSGLERPGRRAPRSSRRRSAMRFWPGFRKLWNRSRWRSIGSRACSIPSATKWSTWAIFRRCFWPRSTSRRRPGILRRHDPNRGRRRAIPSRRGWIRGAITPIWRKPAKNFRSSNSPFYQPFGYPQGHYRVGPLARLNVAKFAGTASAPIANCENSSSAARDAVCESFHYHLARLIEMLHAVERIEELMADAGTVRRNHPGQGLAESARRRRLLRSSARHVVPSLLGGCRTA